MKTLEKPHRVKVGRGDRRLRPHERRYLNIMQNNRIRTTTVKLLLWMAVIITLFFWCCGCRKCYTCTSTITSKCINYNLAGYPNTATLTTNDCTGDKTGTSTASIQQGIYKITTTTHTTCQ